MKLIRLPLALVLAGSVTAANCPTVTVVCPDNLVPSLSVWVRDANTNSLIAKDASVVVVGPAFRDSVTLMSDDRPYVAFEDSAGVGTYTVTVRKSGYVDYVNHNVRVTRDDRCHVNNTTVNALLSVH